MRKIMKLCRSRSGNGYVWACVMVLVLFMFFTVISEAIRIHMTALGIRNALQEAVLTVTTENYDEIYNGLREGYSGGYTLKGITWSSNLDEGDVMEYLQEILELEEKDGYYRKVAGTEEEYRLSDLEIQIINAPFAPGSPETVDKFEAAAYLNVEIPYSFGWDMVPPLQMRIKVVAGYTPKF